jgi:lysozyme
MQISQKGLVEIASHEAVVLCPYLDSVGVWTIFIGHTAAAGGLDPAKLPKGVARPLSEALSVFAVDIKKYEARVNRAFKVPLKQHEYDASASFDYNTGGILRASWVKAFNRGERELAVRQIMNWVTPPEIKGRRKKEQRLFDEGVYSSNGYVNVYRANSRGRVLWSEGKRIRFDGAIFMEQGKPPAASGDPMDDGMLVRGERGPAVMQLQKDLQALGYYKESKVDHIFGPKTEAAVRKLQANWGLAIDGRAGPQTFAAITRLLNEASDTNPSSPMSEVGKPADPPPQPASRRGCNIFRWFRKGK